MYSWSFFHAERDVWYKCGTTNKSAQSHSSPSVSVQHMHAPKSHITARKSRPKRPHLKAWEAATWRQYLWDTESVMSWGRMSLNGKYEKRHTRFWAMGTQSLFMWNVCCCVCIHFGMSESIRIRNWRCFHECLQLKYKEKRPSFLPGMPRLINVDFVNRPWERKGRKCNGHLPLYHGLLGLQG